MNGNCNAMKGSHYCFMWIYYWAFTSNANSSAINVEGNGPIISCYLLLSESSWLAYPACLNQDFLGWIPHFGRGLVLVFHYLWIQNTCHQGSGQLMLTPWTCKGLGSDLVNTSPVTTSMDSKPNLPSSLHTVNLYPASKNVLYIMECVLNSASNGKLVFEPKCLLLTFKSVSPLL